MLAALAVAALPAFAHAQAAAPAVVVQPVPAIPFRGSVARLLVDPGGPATGADTLLRVDGEAAGEPLHFQSTPSGGFGALLGVPLEGGDSLPIVLRVERPGGSDTTEVMIAVQTPRLASERLTVAPSMVQFDSATRKRIADEQAQGREVSRRAHETPTLWSGPFRLPRPSRITSRYGTAREYNGQVTSRHLGTDFAGKIGAPVRAPAAAVVALAADFYLAGRALYLDHGGGLVTGYFHLSRRDVETGDTVRAGQLIGAVGRSGRVTGPHLHWIARYGAITVDPMSLLQLK